MRLEVSDQKRNDTDMGRVIGLATLVILLVTVVPVVLMPTSAQGAEPPRDSESMPQASFANNVLLMASSMVGGGLLTVLALLFLKPTPPVPALPLPPQEAQSLLNDQPWLKLVEECVELLDELDRNMDSFDPAQRELAEHVLWRMQEILARCGVEPIKDETSFDRLRHQPAHGGANIAAGANMASTLSPGFAVENRVLRRARVLLSENA